METLQTLFSSTLAAMMMGLASIQVGSPTASEISAPAGSTPAITTPVTAPQSPIGKSPITQVPITQIPAAPAPQTPTSTEATSAVTNPPVTTTPTTRKPRKITNVFTDADVRTVIQEVANASGASILADTSVKASSFNIEFKNDTIESALDKMSAMLGLYWKKRGNDYLMTSGAPDAPLFDEFAVTKVYMPKTQPAESLFALLSQSYKVYAQLDKGANLLSVTAPEAKADAVIAAIEKADRPRRQFVIEALVTEVTKDEGKETGFTWSWKYFAQDVASGFSYAAATQSDIVSIKAMISNGDATLKANPKLMAAEGREASLTVGNETFLPLATGNAGQTSTQYQRVNTGISLKFTGFIDNGELNLHVQPEVSDLITQQNGNPTSTVRKVDTYLHMKFGETIAIGGLIQDTTSDQRTKVPVLGDIPILGQAFRTSTKAHHKSEVIILLTPRLVDEKTSAGS